MKILKHGIFYNKKDIIKCQCGCEFEYNEKDILVDNSFTLTSLPSQYNRYVFCPECHQKIKLSNIYKSDISIKYYEGEKK